MRDRHSEFQEFEFSNGLNLYVLQTDVSWQYLGFMVHSGSGEDPVGLEGLAHLTEHMVVENNPSNDFRNFFKSLGGFCELGTTRYFSIEYQFFVPAKQKLIRRGLEFFEQILLRSILSKNLNQEKKVVAMEFKEDFAVPMYFEFYKKKMQSLFPGHRLKGYATGLGSPESIANIKKEDVQGFYNLHYNSSNASVIAVGGLKCAQIEKLLAQSGFAKRKAGFRNQIIPPSDNIPEPVPETCLIKLSDYSDIAFDFGAFVTSATLPSIRESTNQILSLMLDEILLREIREKNGWAYYVETERRSYGDVELFDIKCSRLAKAALPKIERIVNECIKSVKGDRSSFEKVKSSLLNGLLMRDQNGEQILESAMSNLREYRRIISVKEDEENIRKVTFHDVVERVKYLSPDRRWTLIEKP